MVGYEKVVDVLRAFKVVCLSRVTYNKQDLRYIMMKLVRTIGKHAPPHSVEHHGGTYRNSDYYGSTQQNSKVPEVGTPASRPVSPPPVSLYSIEVQVTIK